MSHVRVSQEVQQRQEGCTATGPLLNLVTGDSERAPKRVTRRSCRGSLHSRVGPPACAPRMRCIVCRTTAAVVETPGRNSRWPLQGLMTHATALGIGNDNSLLHLPEPQKCGGDVNRKGCVHISINEKMENILSDCNPLWRPVCHQTQKAKKVRSCGEGDGEPQPANCPLDKLQSTFYSFRVQGSGFGFRFRVQF